MLLSPGRATPPQLGGGQPGRRGAANASPSPEGSSEGGDFPTPHSQYLRSPLAPLPSCPRANPAACPRARPRKAAAPGGNLPLPPGRGAAISQRPRTSPGSPRRERARRFRPAAPGRPMNPSRPRGPASPRLASPQRARRWRRRRVRSWAAAWSPGAEGRASPPVRGRRRPRPLGVRGARPLAPRDWVTLLRQRSGLGPPGV